MALLLVVIDVDHRLLPLAGRDLALEHDVNFTVRATLHLGQAPPGYNETDECSGAPNVAALSAEVSTRGVQHVGGN